MNNEQSNCHLREYIVTYASIFPSRVAATPSRILVYEEITTVDGLVVPTRYSIYEKNHSLYAACKIRDWSFNKPFDAARMTMPAGAVIDISSPTRAN